MRKKMNEGVSKLEEFLQVLVLRGCLMLLAYRNKMYFYLGLEQNNNVWV